MKKSLDLSSDQVKKITAIKMKQAKKEIANYKKVQKKTADRRRKVKSAQAKIESVLTDEQAKKWESIHSRAGLDAGSRVGFGGNGFQR